MNSRTIIIESNISKKGKLDRKPFTCQVFESMNKKTYVLDNTKRELVHKHFTLTIGCRIIDKDVIYFIENIWYPPAPKHPHLIVSLEPIV